VGEGSHFLKVVVLHSPYSSLAAQSEGEDALVCCWMSGSGYVWGGVLSKLHT